MLFSFSFAIEKRNKSTVSNEELQWAYGAWLLASVLPSEPPLSDALSWSTPNAARALLHLRKAKHMNTINEYLLLLLLLMMNFNINKLLYGIGQ